MVLARFVKVEEERRPPEWDEFFVKRLSLVKKRIRIRIMEAPLKLGSNKQERQIYDNLADLFAIIKTTEKLETAYVRDEVTAQLYEPACNKLIGQYRMLWNSIKDTVPDVEKFMRDYSMQCPMAVARLIKSGVPATIEHGRTDKPGGGTAKDVAQTVASFITTTDTIKMGMTAVDEIQPLLIDLLQSINSLPELPPDFPAKAKIKSWTTKLNQHAANYQLTEDDKRQLLFDLETSYDELHRTWH